MNVGIYLGLALLGLMVLEPLLEDWIVLQAQRLQLFFNTFLMKVRLEYEIFQIGRNKNKYLDFVRKNYPTQPEDE